MRNILFFKLGNYWWLNCFGNINTINLILCLSSVIDSIAFAYLSWGRICDANFERIKTKPRNPGMGIFYGIVCVVMCYIVPRIFANMQLRWGSVLILYPYGTSSVYARTAIIHFVRILNICVFINQMCIVKSFDVDFNWKLKVFRKYLGRHWSIKYNLKYT